MDKKFLEELCEIDGIASNEFDVAFKLKNKFKNADRMLIDGLGSQIFEYSSEGPKIMFAAHMDEVGFMIKNIRENGLIDLIPIGGVKETAKGFQKARITTSEGSKIIGLINSTDDKLYMDIGVDSDKSVENLGIDIGDMVCFASKSEWLNEDILMAKALDDRIGNFILSEVAKEINNLKERKNSIYLCNTVQEEVGTRGGKCSTDIIKPDVFFAIDVATAPDLNRGCDNHRKIGNGFMILHYDKTMIPNKKFLNYIKNLAKENNIIFQKDMFGGGGTDAGNAHLVSGGRLAIVLGVPLRYCHGNYSMVNMKDVESLIKFIVEIIKDLDTDKLKDIKKYV
ncbi:M20/M25/M40 family metallo-hydrolase [Peptacetobacter sp.]|uniref:M20/M25/M40 family metallo-hydrolase n=1 Tax=Peptacetobacter sp. TaxID=2991975 RepID=UPI00261A4E96|nr:M20/M25/M40 family metallo-hydrolase [Peptacetobacter sp.]